MDPTLAGDAAVGDNLATWATASSWAPELPEAAARYDVRLQLSTGEVHLLIEDAETARPGIGLVRLSPDDGAELASRMHWDDRAVVVGDLDEDPDPAVTSAEGVDPAMADHGWGDFDGDDGPGNGAWIDTWAPAAVGSQDFTLLVGTAALDSDEDGLTDLRECLVGSDPGVADTDGDGVPDLEEVGAGDPPDTDDDGTPDFADPDDDGDGVPTRDELESGAGHDDDPDEDGLPAYLDDDSDGDGVLDGDESLGDLDGDGTPDFLQPPPSQDPPVDDPTDAGSTPVDGGIPDGGELDGGEPDGGEPDGGEPDGGGPSDAGAASDTGEPSDAGVAADAGDVADASSFEPDGDGGAAQPDAAVPMGAEDADLPDSVSQFTAQGSGVFRCAVGTRGPGTSGAAVLVLGSLMLLRVRRRHRARPRR